MEICKCVNARVIVPCSSCCIRSRPMKKIKSTRKGNSSSKKHCLQWSIEHIRIHYSIQQHIPLLTIYIYTYSLHWILWKSDDESVSFDVWNWTMIAWIQKMMNYCSHFDRRECYLMSSSSSMGLFSLK